LEREQGLRGKNTLRGKRKRGCRPDARPRVTDPRRGEKSIRDKKAKSMKKGGFTGVKELLKAHR